MLRLCTAAIALRHQIMVTANEVNRMDCLYRRNALGQACGAVEKVPLLHKRNRLRPQIYANSRGRIEPPIEPVGQSAI